MRGFFTVSDAPERPVRGFFTVSDAPERPAPRRAKCRAAKARGGGAMPTPPLRPCTSPGCPNRVAKGRCSVHARLAGQQRDGWRQLYGSEWPRVRLDYLSRNPGCVLCTRMATVADHYPRGIRLLRKQGNAEPHADRHLRALCASCHSKETMKREPGGFTTRFT